MSKEPEKQLHDERLGRALRAVRDVAYEWDLTSGDVWRSVPHADDPTQRSHESGRELWTQAIHPADRGRVTNTLQQALRQNLTLWSERYRCRQAAGSYEVVWDRAQIEYDANGAPVRMIGALTNVSEHEETVDRLRVSEARYRALVRAASDAVWIHNPSADSAEASEGLAWWEALTGQPAAETDGWGWLAMVHPDDRDAVRERWTECRQSGTPYQSDYRLRMRDGSYRHFHVRGVPVREADGSISEWVGMFADETDRRQAEAALRRSQERFRAFMDNSPAAASIIDVDGCVLYVSEGFRRMFRLPPGEPVGRTLFDLFSTEIARAWLDASCQAMLSDEALEAIEPGIRADGTDGLFLTYRFPLRDTGEARLVGSVAADITELRRLEDQLRQVQKMEAVGQLARGVAHDFNNVLTVIQGFSDLMLKELPPGHDLTEPLAEIKKAGERAAQLTGQLLAFSRKAVVRPVVLDLNAVLSDAENMLRRLVGEDIELTTMLEPRLWRIKADPVQIDQVLLNFVSNARDAMPQGGGLTLETRNVHLGSQTAERRQTVPPGTYVSLSVTDTGCGMDPATMERIFEPFFTTKPPGKGTGMGLAAVYGIVQQLGGHIRVQSQPGIGTSFSIYLPPRHEHVAEPTSSGEVQPAPQGQETILLVEDDPAVRALSQKVLVRHGYLVLEASNGIEALRVSRGHAGKIDLIVTDVVMPHMSGPQLVEQLCRERPDVKILYVSGYPDDALGTHGVIDPNVTLLQKPFMPSALANKVRSVLDS